MAQFEVDFSESTAGMIRLQAGVSALGTALDAVETKANKPIGAAGQLMKRFADQFKTIGESLKSVGMSADGVTAGMEKAQAITTAAMAGIAAANLKATVTAEAYRKENVELLRILNDTRSKNAYIQSMTRIAGINDKLVNSNKELQHQIAALDSPLARQNSALRIEHKLKQDLLALSDKTIADNKLLKATLENMNSVRSKENEVLRQSIANKQAEYRETTQLVGKLEALKREYASLDGGLQQHIVKMQQQIAERKRVVTESAREEAQIRTLKRTLESLTGGRQEEIAKLNAQISARQRAIAETIQEKKVVDELAAAIKREQDQLTRLRAQSMLMSGAHGQQVTALRSQIAEQTNLNNLRAMSTRQLLGLHGAQERHNLSMQAGSQLAASLRAGITGLHASFGMYTSATVLAASATYAFTSGLRDSVITGAEFFDTMQRTKAIMSTGGPSWLTTQGDYAQAMEEQVRALGMTTVYTASEVGHGLQELGKAGFSASESIQALPASLQLANLANVSMSRSADIATNVLMTFGKEANQLGSVVDLMATAVNNSNTDIEQLANALTYVGPAAQTAGISLEETVAAVEALANSGFKSSRAGTGLRRLFVSLLNPTKKGAEVLEKFNVSVLDAEGQTRSLVDIVGQLNRAMSGLSKPDQLGAVQDLVGTYASSQVAALIAQFDNFKKFANENDPNNVKGAADRMEKIINDSLSKDWKTLLSAVEEVQLTAFSQMDTRLRRQVASLSTWVLDLLKPSQEGFGVFTALTDNYKELVYRAEEGSAATARQAAAVDKLAAARERLANAKTAKAAAENDPATSPQKMAEVSAQVEQAQKLVDSAQITRLDRMLVQIENTARVLGPVIAGIVAFKFANGSIFAGIARDLTGPTGANNRLQEFSRRQTIAAQTAIAHAQATRVATGSLSIYSLTTATARTGVVGLTSAMIFMNTWIAKAASAFGLLSRALGWVGLVAGIGYAIYGAFSSSTEKDILAQRDAVDEVKSSYEQLAEAIKNSGLERQKQAMVLAQTADQKSADQFGTKLTTTKKLLKDAEEAGADPQVIKLYKEEIENLEASQKEYNTRVTEAAVDLDKMGKSELDVMSAQDQRLKTMAEMVALQRQLNSARAMASSGDAGNGEILSELERQKRELQDKLNNNNAKIDLTKREVVPISAFFADEASRRAAEAEELKYKKLTSNAQKLYDVNVKIAEQEKKARDLEALDKNAIDKNLPRDERAGRDTAERISVEMKRLEAEKLELVEKTTEEVRQREIVERDIAAKGRTDQENMLAYKARDLELEKQIAAARNPGEGKAVDNKKLTDLLREQLQVKGDIETLDKRSEKASNSAEKASERAAKKTAAQLEKDFNAYEQLAKKYDAQSYALIQMNEGIEAMARLRQQNIDTMGKEGITAGQQARATAELRKQYYLSTLEMDKHYQAFIKVRDAYGDSPYDQAAKDLAELNYQVSQGTISLQESSRLANNIRTQRQSKFDNLPKVDESQSTGSDSTVFGGFARNVISYSSDMQTFKDTENDLWRDDRDARNNLDIQLKQQLAEQEAAGANAEEMLRIKQNDYDKRRAMDQAYGEDNQKVQLQMYKYQQANGKMMEIAAVGMMSSIFGMFAAVGKDATGAQKAAFIASKALAVAQIIMYTELAAIKAMSAPDVPFFGMQLPAANLIRGFGYASAGLVTGLSIASLATGSDMTGQASGGANMYDTGGNIPYNRVGIVGEYGPELVSGPVSVKGRTATANALSGGDSGMHVTIAPVTHVTVDGGGGDSAMSQNQGKQIAAVVNSLVEKQVQTMTREGGLLDQWRRST